MVSLLIEPTRTSGQGEAIVAGIVRKVSWRRLDFQDQGGKGEVREWKQLKR